LTNDQATLAVVGGVLLLLAFVAWLTNAGRGH
jgi:hypothetical protein